MKFSKYLKLVFTKEIILIVIINTIGCIWLYNENGSVIYNNLFAAIFSILILPIGFIIVAYLCYKDYKK